MANFSIKAQVSLGSLFELPLERTFRALSPPPEERLTKAKEARKLQLQQYEQRELELEQRSPKNGRQGRGGSKKVSFQVKEKLRDAVLRSDIEEGMWDSCRIESVQFDST